MPDFKISLVNMDNNTSKELTKLIRNDRLGTYSFHQLNSFKQGLDDNLLKANFIIIYELDFNEIISFLQTRPVNIPIVLVTNNITFEAERSAKQHGIDFIVEQTSEYLTSIIYGFIRQFKVYQGYKALVIDDSRIDSQVNAHLLNTEHIANEIENRAENAIERLKADESINIILVDYEMPVINGGDLINKIRHELPIRSFIFVGLTGSRNGALKFSQQGIDLVLQKPLDTEIFALSLRKTIFDSHRLKGFKNSVSDYHQLLTRLSHDIRGPIGIIRTVTELLFDGKEPNENTTELLDIFHSNNHKLDEFFSELLNYIEVNQFQESLKHKRYSLHSLIAQSLLTESHQAKQKNIIINKYFDKGIEADCVGHQIESVIANLTNNAVKYSKQGGQTGKKQTTSFDHLTDPIDRGL